MTFSLTKHDEGYLLNKKIYIAPVGTSSDKKYINIKMQTGQDMHYGNHDMSYIDYPGEYDLQGIFFTVTAGKGGELNYLIDDGHKAYAFVQTEDALNDEDFNADYWIYTNQHIAKTLERMELEGEKIDLATIE